MLAFRLLLLAAICGVLAPQPSRADGRAESALHLALRTLHAAKAYRADVTVTIRNGTMPAETAWGTVALMKPNYLRVELSGSMNGRPGVQKVTMAADGTAYTIYMAGDKQYMRQPLPAHPTTLNGMWGQEIDGFFGGEKLIAGKQVGQIGAETVDGVLCDRVSVRLSAVDSAEFSIGRADHLIRRMVRKDTSHGLLSSITSELRNVRLNPSLQVAQFRFTLPAGAMDMAEPMNAKLLPVGSAAPDFDVARPDGGRLTLAEARKGARAVLINFWFYG